jgi:hypothetical protein
MTLLHDLQQVSLFALLTVGIGVIPLLIGLLYVARPTERWLALMRPLSLAGIFAALASLMSGVMVMLHGIAATGKFSIESAHLIALGVAEAVTPMFLIFGSLSVAWLLVALGMRRERGA